MNSYIILLRGINVGGKNILSMKNLRELLSNNGFTNVKTYIQSGNIFAQASSATAKKVSSLIQSEFGFTPDTMILDEKEFLNSAKHNPFAASDGKLVHLYFCSDTPSPNKDRLTSLKTATEEYLIRDKVFYLHAPDGIGRSKLVSNLESCLDTRATGRNLNTIRKLQELAQAD